MFPFSYTSRYKDIGQGAEVFALVGPYLPRQSAAYGPRYNVRGTIAPLTSAGAISPKLGPTNSVKANGVYLSGDIALQALSDMMSQKDK